MTRHYSDSTFVLSDEHGLGSRSLRERSLIRAINAHPTDRQQIKRFNQVADPLIKDCIRPQHRRFMERVMLGQVRPSTFVVLSAIASRTLGWNKIIEIIPLSTLKSGLCASGVEEDLVRTDDELPAFGGTNLDVNTIRKAVDELVARGLVEKFSMRSAGRDVCAYMPMSALAFVSLYRRYMLGRDELEELPDELVNIAEAQVRAKSDLERMYVLHLARSLVG